jgi:recombination protein RecA
MAKQKTSENKTGMEEDFSADLIKALNKEFGSRVAYNLETDESPTHVKRWISTGCIQLDYIFANRKNGGVPEGRIIEIFGEPSTGKSHIAFAIAKTVQAMGGLVVYIDTENATPVEKLGDMGIDVGSRFVYCDTHCTEEVFKIVESTILKAKSIVHKNVPILCVYDSVAASSPKAELEGDYDTQTIGLQARTISKAMRKITGVIGQNNVTFLCLNQVRMKIGVMFGDPTTTPGGKAIPFHASLRLGLTGGTQVKDAKGNVIGINVIATTKKNKLAPPFRKVRFKILFGEGIDEGEELYNALFEYLKKNEIVIDGKEMKVTGTGSWKTLEVTDAKTGEVLIEKKFQKSGFMALLDSKEYGPILNAMLEDQMVVKTSRTPEVSAEDLLGDGEDETEEAKAS